MPTTTRTPRNPPPAPTRRNRKTLLTVGGAVLILIALAVTAVIAYNIGKPDHSVRVERSGTGTVAVINGSGTAGCVEADGHRMCSAFAVQGPAVKVGDKVGYAHEWVNVQGGSADLLLLYPLNQ